MFGPSQDRSCVTPQGRCLYPQCYQNTIGNGAPGSRKIGRLEKRGEMTMKLAKAALLLTLASTAAWAQVNAGEQKPEANPPFTMTTVTTFTLPWRLAFLPDGRMLITEKAAPLWR